MKPVRHASGIDPSRAVVQGDDDHCRKKQAVPQHAKVHTQQRLEIHGIPGEGGHEGETGQAQHSPHFAREQFISFEEFHVGHFGKIQCGWPIWGWPGGILSRVVYGTFIVTEVLDKTFLVAESNRFKAPVVLLFMRALKLVGGI